MSNEVQKGIEKYLLDFKSDITKKELSLLHELNVNFLGGSITSVIKDKLPLIESYIDLLLKSKDKKDILNIEIHNVVGKQYIFDLCIYFFT